MYLMYYAERGRVSSNRKKLGDLKQSLHGAGPRGSSFRPATLRSAPRRYLANQEVFKK